MKSKVFHRSGRWPTPLNGKNKRERAAIVVAALLIVIPNYGLICFLRSSK
jgi:hypothetical protein